MVEPSLPLQLSFPRALRRQIALTLRPMCCGGVCVAMSCGGGYFTPGGVSDSVWDSVKPMTGKYFFNYFQYQEVRWVCMHAEFLFSSNDNICPDNYIFSWLKLKDKCRSEKWEVYLYGDMTIMVMEF